VKRPRRKKSKEPRPKLPHVPDGSENDWQYIGGGATMSAEMAARLEERLQESTDDLATRLQLIGYYRRNSRKKDDVRASMVHLIWMAENRPRDYCVYYFGLGDDYTPKQFGQFREAWLRQIDANPDDDQIIGNTANIISYRDRELAKKLFRRAQVLNPQEPRWSRRLAQMYRCEAMNGPRLYRPQCAQQAVAETEKYLKLKDVRGEHTGILEQMPPMAIEFGYLKEARKWSKELLNYGRHCIFRVWAQNAYLHLARIELAEKKPRRAHGWLRKAIDSLSTGEPTHVIEGDRMMVLLNELLKNGDREIVIDALKVCTRKCSEDNREQMKAWYKQVRKGETPTLGWRTRWR
jgi:hypothetical protein